MSDLIYLAEPTLQFGYQQALEDPRDGLTLFGPLDAGKPYGIRAGVVGTPEGIERFRRWVEWIQGPIWAPGQETARPPFPGFAGAFRIPWATTPVLTIELDADELLRRVTLDDGHQRVYKTVGLYSEKLIRAHLEEEIKPDVWFVVIPDIVRTYCRPKAVVDPEVRQEAVRMFRTPSRARHLLRSPLLFAEANIAAEPYFYKNHFRNQLKARLLDHQIPTQVLREGTLDNIGPGTTSAEQTQAVMQSAIAWNVSTTTFYKAGGRPWKVQGIRDGVCYLGLVYKKDNSPDERMACCGAQMFLDSGDGVVFKGAVGPWYQSETREFHLSRGAARNLLTLAINAYKEKHNNNPPREIFVHGQTAFNREEWRGFTEAAPGETSMVGVKIRDDATLKLFHSGKTPVLRGLAYPRHERAAYLWTRGWIPRMQTYPGREVPNPLSVEISQGEAPIDVVLADVLALTKLNYNACVFADGKPITLKFADAVGEVLTAGPIANVPPLPFMYYI